VGRLAIQPFSTARCYAAIHPIQLKTALEEAQTELSAHATRSHSAVMQRMVLGQVPL
jgi:hypothetical protein